MKAFGHSVGGIGAGLIAAQFASTPEASVVLVFSALIGSLAPDLDHPRARLSRCLGPVWWILWSVVSNPITWWVAGRAAGHQKPMKEGRAAVRRMCGHRGITHSLVGLLGAGMLWGLGIGGVGHVALGGAPSEAVVVSTLGFAAGYASHLLLDMMTPSGVPLLLPLQDRRFWVLPRFARIPTR